MGGSGIDFFMSTDRPMLVEWAGKKKVFFWVGATIFGLGWGVFFSFSLLFFWDEECVSVGGEEVFLGLSLRHTPILLRGGGGGGERDDGRRQF